ncbi:MULTISPECIES: hypothetical protein [unclassified Rhizobium]|uniref:hypothetical protein n=1 Tax=unclassified Rhizobium TaxID=2613769 RepID=UPI0010476BFB|nr:MULTISPECIES: hypothetical protein [unclassified Rhizobium]MBB3393466.1 hypothetical protein [Rhizobium sp. BK060]MBB4170440.1 hypothetical protein [Rhizobium sp. BK538]TCM81928.1 hypothetical protein EV291_101406 [Rhizobium sp. BK068]
MIFMIVAVAILLVFFFLFPRPTLIALIAVIFVGAGVGVYVYFQQSDRNNSASLVVGTSTGTQGCLDPAKPVFVQLFNGSDQYVNVVRFRLVAKRPGFSIEAYSDYLSSYKIIEPHGVYGTCWALNQYRGLETLPDKPSPKDFEWNVDISSVDFAEDE